MAKNQNYPMFMYGLACRPQLICYCVEIIISNQFCMMTCHFSVLEMFVFLQKSFAVNALFLDKLTLAQIPWPPGQTSTRPPGQTSTRPPDHQTTRPPDHQTVWHKPSAGRSDKFTRGLTYCFWPKKRYILGKCLLMA